MQTILDFHQAIQQRFPELASAADQDFSDRWGAWDPCFAYSWFECLSRVVNGRMLQDAAPASLLPLFSFISAVLQDSSDEVADCIDVAFVENLFWQVPGPQALGFWAVLPPALRQLYLDFHHRAPV